MLNESLSKILKTMYRACADTVEGQEAIGDSEQHE